MDAISKLCVEEANQADIPQIVDYWASASPEHLTSMGVDITKMPSSMELTEMLSQQFLLPYEEKRALALVWRKDGNAIGHCNVNEIHFGENAKMHLHMWGSENRSKGMGTHLVKLSIPVFFERLKLNQLICEPFAENNAPNRTLERVGFRFEKRYTTIPGSINTMQEVNRWVFQHSQYLELVNELNK
ncbi:MAG: GNAT family N-acetyltransferase [Bacteroidia bacterium]|nr:GNAT family N-acetyltransferase [Bacteroidia bacterium]